MFAQPVQSQKIQQPHDSLACLRRLNANPHQINDSVQTETSH